MQTTRELALQKVNRRLIPILVAGAVLAHLDRFNVSMASLTMNQDIGLTPSVYGFGVGAFFILYALFEIPSNLALARFGARAWLTRIMATWALVSIATAAVSGPISFVINRALLGAAEAGYQPGVLAFLALWIPAPYRARVFSYFLMAGPIAVIAGGPIAAMILSLDGRLGLHGWQWLFIVEGLPPLFIAILLWQRMSNTPAQASWLSADEAASLASPAAAPRVRDKQSAAAYIRALLTPTVFLATAVLSCLGGINHGVALWLPQIVKSAGLTTTQTGWLSAIPYIAGALAMLLWSRHADRTGEYRWHLAAPAVLAGIALTASVFTPQLGARMLFVTVAMTCVFAVQAVFWSVVSGAIAPQTRTVSMAIITAGGALFGFVAPTAIGISKQLTGSFDAAFAILGSLGVVGGALAVMLVRHLRAQ